MAMPAEQPSQSETDCCWEAVVPPEIKSLIDCVFCKKDISLNADEIKNAKLLLCLHSICQSCADLWKTEETKICPKCRLKLPRRLEENKLVQEFIQEPPSETFLKGMCNEHQTTRAKKWCNECATLVCQTCIETHQSLMISRSHKIVDIDDAEATAGMTLVDYSCPNHRSRQLDVFCDTCQVMTCRDCQLESHKAHNYSFVNKLTEDIKKDLCFKMASFRLYKEMIEASIRQGMTIEDKLVKQKEEAMKQIDALCQSVLTVLHEKFNALKSDLETVVTKRQQEVKQKLRSSSDFINSLMNIYGVIDLIASESSDTTIVFLNKHLRETTDYVRQCPNVEVLNPGVEDRIQFNHENLAKVIVTSFSKFGAIKCTRENVLKPEEHQAYLEKLEDANHRFTQSLKLLSEEIENSRRLNPEASPVESVKRIHVKSDREILLMDNRSADASSSSSPSGIPPLWHKPTDISLSSKTEMLSLQEPNRPSPPAGVSSTTDCTLRSPVNPIGIPDAPAVGNLNRLVQQGSLTVSTDCPSTSSTVNDTAVAVPSPNTLAYNSMIEQMLQTSYVASANTFSVPSQNAIYSQQRATSTKQFQPGGNRYNMTAQPDQQTRPIPVRNPKRRPSASGLVQNVNQPQANQIRRHSDTQGPPPAYPELTYAPSYCQTTVVQQQQILLPTNLQPLPELGQMLMQNNPQNPALPQQNFGMNQYTPW